MDSRASQRKDGMESPASARDINSRDTSTNQRMDEESNSRFKMRVEAIPQFARINQSTRRLVVQSITLENFKSYQGKQVIGPFDDVKDQSYTEICLSDRSKRFRKVQFAGIVTLHFRPQGFKDEVETPEGAHTQLCQPL
jgi:hypothetical protein